MTKQPEKGKFFTLKPCMSAAPKPSAMFENEQHFLTPLRLLLTAAKDGFPPLKQTPRLAPDPAK